MKYLQSIAAVFAKYCASISWERLAALFNGGIYYKMTESELDYIRSQLKKNHLVILNRKNCHLTTYLISLASFVLTGKFSHYSHALMNVEGDNISVDEDYKLIEAQSIGVKYSTFMEVFNCDSVALLIPRGLTPEEWTGVLEMARCQYGKPYDDMFDLLDTENVSCVEMVRVALQSLPNYKIRFAKLEYLIHKYKNLTPQMFYDCGDFDVFYEVRH